MAYPATPREYTAHPYPEFNEPFKAQAANEDVVVEGIPIPQQPSQLNHPVSWYLRYGLMLKITLIMTVVALVLIFMTVPRENVYRKGTVVTENPTCSDVGVKILQKDGNAIDAAIATSFCMGVVHPMTSGLGGGGMMMYRTADGQTKVLDFIPMAPGDVTDEMYRTLGVSLHRGKASIAIPALVKGLYAAHALNGTLPWKTLVAPAIALARNGFVVSKFLADSIAENMDVIRSSEQLREAFLVGEQPVAQGSTVALPRLADTLEQIALSPEQWQEAGHTAYINDLQSTGLGNVVVTEQEILRKQVMLREPMYVFYRGQRIFLPPPPSFSGIATLAFINWMAKVDLATLGPGVMTTHASVEGIKNIMTREGLLGDPQFSPMGAVAVSMADDEFAMSFLRIFHESQAMHNASAYGGGPLPPERSGGAGGMGISVVDQDGMAVSLVESMGSPFGSGVVLPQTGILLNNQMADFTMLEEGVPNPNEIEGFKRPVSQLAPALVTLDNRIRHVISVSGGPQTFSCLSEALVNLLAFERSPHLTVTSTRFYPVFTPAKDELLMERTVALLIPESLQKKGHKVVVVSQLPSAASLVAVLDDVYLPATDHRRNPAYASGY